MVNRMDRCLWPNLENSPLYQQYHDEEWGVPSRNNSHLFEMFILETFHCGLSWLLILKKREGFRQAFDQFNAEKIALYQEDKIQELMENADIVRNKAKILATIQNAKAYLKVQEEWGSFSEYLWSFTENKVIYQPFDGVTTRNEISDRVAKDLKKRGFKFMGTVTCYSYLEAVGIFNDHGENCYKFVPEQDRNE